MSRFLLGIILTLSVFSCKKDDAVVAITELKVQVQLPEEMQDQDLTGITIKATNKNNGIEKNAITDNTGLAILNLEEGIYNIETTQERELKVSIGDGSFKKNVNIVGTEENLRITGNTVNINLALNVSINSAGWVIKEIYISGTPITDSKRTYYYDQFFEIYNNSDKPLNAKGLAIGESNHVSVFPENQWGNTAEYVALQTVYSIPETTDYMVEPGKSIVIASRGINHILDNANSIDLSQAQFEWYDGSFDVDVPEVPNLIKNYAYSPTIWVASMQTNRSYVIFQVDEELQTYVDSHLELRPGSTRIKGVLVKNEYVLDAVELSQEGKLQSKALDPSLDLSYAYITGPTKGKSFRRKVKAMVGTRTVYKDTNNSAEDFEILNHPTPFIQATK